MRFVCVAVASSNALPDTLQQADINVLSTQACSDIMRSVDGAAIWDAHICLFDTNGNVGTCNVSAFV